MTAQQFLIAIRGSRALRKGSLGIIARSFRLLRIRKNRGFTHSLRAGRRETSQAKTGMMRGGPSQRRGYSFILHW